jgi:hypothetical protein
MKACVDCKETLPMESFPAAPSCKDGRRRYCKACMKIRRVPQRLANREAHSAKRKEWAARNADRVRAIKRKYNQSLTLEKRRVNKARCVARNPGPYRASVSARRAHLRRATPPWVSRRYIEAVYLLAGLLDLTVDHIIPVRGKTVCGLHVPWNMQLLPLSENSKKHASFVEPTFEEVVGWAEKRTPIQDWGWRLVGGTAP